MFIISVSLGFNKIHQHQHSMADQNDLSEWAKIKGPLASGGYDLDGQLGKGRFGTVYAVTRKDESGKKHKYAIKVMSIDSHKIKPKYPKRELELLMRMAQQETPNIIKYFGNCILDFGKDERLCILMELCSLNLEKFVCNNKIGGPAIIQAEGPPRFYQQVFEQILNGLVYIHSIDWVHRDIHLGNILIVNPHPRSISDIHVKIADFGLARHIGADFHPTESEYLGGYEKLTPLGKEDQQNHFLAPEIKTNTYDFRVDVYSAGVVLYFICRHPIVSTDVLNNELEQIIKGKLDVRTYIHHKDDEKLGKVLKALLQHEPSERPSAGIVKEYMFSKRDAPLTANFLARKDDEEDLTPCKLNKLTISALREAIESGTGVALTDRQVLRQERQVNGEKRRYIKILRDDYVREMFQEAAAKGHEVVVVIRENPGENAQIGQISSEDQAMTSV